MVSFAAILYICAGILMSRPRYIAYAVTNLACQLAKAIWTYDLLSSAWRAFEGWLGGHFRFA